MPESEYQKLRNSPQHGKDFVLRVLAQLEADTRRLALLALHDWQQLQIPSEQLFSAVAGLKSPDWGTFNGLIQALIDARNFVMRSGTAPQRLRVQSATAMADILTAFERPIPTTSAASAVKPLAQLLDTRMPESVTVHDALKLAIILAGHVKLSAPTDPDWWGHTDSALRLMLGLLPQGLARGTLDAPQAASPWFVVEGGEVYTYSGSAPDFSGIYVRDDGVIRPSSQPAQQLVSAFAQLLGHAEARQNDLDNMIARLAPREIKGFLLGDFLVGPPVGQGGFGAVHIGRQLSTGRRVAVKILHDGMDPAVKIRFRHEAAYLSRFHHPNIVHVLAYGEESWILPRHADMTGEAWFESFSKSAPVKTYIAMEWIEGQTLDALFGTARANPGNRPSIRQISEWFLQAARAVAAVHAAGLIHRDIKPGNLMVNHDGVIKLMDFGIARRMEKDRTLQTTAGRFFGTVVYMSPEQLRAAEADALVGPAVDIYSLCATFYELFTLQRLYQHDSQSAQVVTTMKLQGLPPRLPRQQSRDLPWEIEVILMGGLETEPSDRYDSMEALQRDIQHFLADQPIEYRRPSIVRRVRLGYRRHRVAANLTAVIAALILAVGIYWWRLPGTLSVYISPRGSVVRIADRVYLIKSSPLQISLPSGVYHVLAHKPGYRDQSFDVYIARGGVRSLPRIQLAHDQGTLASRADPRKAGAEIAVDGVEYGSRINHLPLDTGLHKLSAWADGYFESRRVVRIVKNKNTRSDFWLDNAMVWPKPYRSTGVQGTFYSVPAIDRRGSADIFVDEIDTINIISGATGKSIWELPMTGNQLRAFRQFNLGGTLGTVVLAGQDGDTLAGAFRMRMDVIAPESLPAGPRVWTWAGPIVPFRRSQGLNMIPIRTRAAGTSADIAVAGRNGSLYLLDPAADRAIGRTILTHKVLTASPHLRAVLHGKSSAILFSAAPGNPDLLTAHAGPLITGLVALNNGTFFWHRDIKTANGSLIRYFDPDNKEGILYWNTHSWFVLNGDTGLLLYHGHLPAGRQLPLAPWFVGGQGQSRMVMILSPARPQGPVVAINISNGQILWRSPSGVCRSQSLDQQGNLSRTAGGDILLFMDSGLAAINPFTGAVIWKYTSAVRPGFLLQDDLYHNGQQEIIIGVRQHGIVCLSEKGRVRWRLRLKADLSPHLLLPPSNGVGPAQVLISRHASEIALIHTPDVLWRKTATAQLQATPLIADFRNNGKTMVVQLGPWPGEDSLRAFDGATGTPLWSQHVWFAPNRAPVLAHWMHHRTLDVIGIGRKINGRRVRLFVFRGSDGKMLCEIPVALKGWLASTPVVADLTGKGTSDVVVESYDQRDIVALDGRTGKQIWTVPTGNVGDFGSPAAAILGPGRQIDIVALGNDGYVYAIRGNDGHVLWKTWVGAGSFAPPIVTNIDGGPEIIGVTFRGQPYVLDGRDGHVIWMPKAPISKLYTVTGQPAVVQNAAKQLLLVPQGDAGLAAYDLRRKTEIWHSPKGIPVSASPVVVSSAHLPAPQVVVAAADGHILVLAPSNGRVLFQTRVGHSFIEGDPAVGDLRGDGKLDIVVADHGFHLTAIRDWSPQNSAR